jgi:uncharacterized protein YkwD
MIIIFKKIIVLCVCISIFFCGCKNILAKTIDRNSVIQATNTYRAKNLQEKLMVSNLLNTAAQLKADDMVAKGYFSHVGPTGDTEWSWFDRVNYVYDYAGENLAEGFTDTSSVLQGWINSSKHKENLLNNNYTEIGVGVAKGKYNDAEAVFVVQFFGKPVGTSAPFW